MRNIHNTLKFLKEHYFLLRQKIVFLISCEHECYVFKIALWLGNTANECRGTSAKIFIPLQSALRVRFSDDIFQQLSRVVGISFFRTAQIFLKICKCSKVTALTREIDRPNQSKSPKSSGNVI